MIYNLHDLEMYRNYKRSEHICYDKLRRYCVTENIDYEYARHSCLKKRSRYIIKALQVLWSTGHGSNITVTNR